LVDPYGRRQRRPCRNDRSHRQFIIWLRSGARPTQQNICRKRTFPVEKKEEEEEEVEEEEKEEEEEEEEEKQLHSLGAGYTCAI
jgi:hypothetical protein